MRSAYPERQVTEKMGGPFKLVELTGLQGQEGYGRGLTRLARYHVFLQRDHMTTDVMFVEEFTIAYPAITLFL